MYDVKKMKNWLLYVTICLFLFGLSASALLTRNEAVSIQSLYPKGFTGQCLQMSGSTVLWAACSSVGNGSLGVTKLTAVGQTQGDLLWFTGATWNRLARGSDHYALKTNGNILAWEALTANSGDVTGSSLSVINGIPLYSSTTGKAIKSDGRLRAATRQEKSLYIGNGSGQFANGSTTNNTALGYRALRFASGADGDNNTAIGNNSLIAVSSGSRNTALGSQTGMGTTTGADNCIMGYNSFASNVSGSFNTSFGTKNMENNFIGDRNVAVGYQTGNNLTSGNSNILIGYQSAINQTDGNGNIAIGNKGDFPNLTGSNQLNIANFLYGNGMSANGSTISPGKIAIGKAFPVYTLDINGTTFSKIFNINGNTLSIPSLGQGSILFSQVAGAFSALDNGAASTHKVLTVNGNTLAWEALAAGGTVTRVFNGDIFATVVDQTTTPKITINNSLIYNGSLFNGDFAQLTTTNLTEGTNQYFTNERVDDRMNGALLVGSTKLTKNYNDGANTLTLDVNESKVTLSNLNGSVTDAQVPNTITLDNITQITTRSHTSLSDIGTNTHAQIDTHISNGNIHINHGAVVLTAGSGLTGGGDISTSRTFTVATNGSLLVTNDKVQLNGDSASPGNSKYYGTNGSGVKGWNTSVAGTVTSVAASGDNGVVILSGSPITSTGTIAFSLNQGATLRPSQNLADLLSASTARTNLALVPGTNVFTQRTFTGDNGVSLTNADGVSGAPRISFDSSLVPAVVAPGGSDTWFQFNDGGSFGGNGAMAFTKASKTLTVPADATLDINSTSVSIADTDITLDGASTTFTQSTGAITMTPANGSNMNITLDGLSDFIVDTSKFIVNDSGNIGIGTATPTAKFELAEFSSAAARGFVFDQFSNDTTSFLITAQKSRGTTFGSHVILGSTDNIINITGRGSNGGQFINVGIIQISMDGTPGATSMPGKIVFQTNRSAQNVTEAMRINSSGNVGIGITSPIATLHTFSSGVPVMMQREDSSTNTVLQSLDIRRTTTGAAAAGLGAAFNFAGEVDTGGVNTIAQISGRFETVAAGNANGGLIFSPSRAGTVTEAMRINSQGNVGIGTTTPATILHAHNVADGRTARVSSIQAATDGGSFMDFAGGAAGTTIRGYVGYGQTGGGTATLFTGELADSFSMRAENALHLGGSGNNLTMTLLSGNVGIGTTAPFSLLDISSATGGVSTMSRNDTSVTAADSIGTIQFFTNDTSTTTNKIAANIEAQATNTISTDINPGRLIFRTTSTTVAASPTERMRIDEAGNVGIADQSPDGLLDINGSLAIAKTITAAGTTGAQTINKATGSVNFAAAATSLVVTNNLVTTSSVILCTTGTNDTTMKSVACVAGAGSFTMNANAAATAETRVNFLVIN